MTIQFRQPPDETPLPVEGLAASIPPEFASLPAMHDEADTARHDIITSAQHAISDINTQVDDARTDIVANALAAASAIDGQAFSEYQSTIKGINRLIKQTDKTIENAYVDLHASGVATPIGMNQILDDLDDSTNTRIAERIFKPDTVGSGGFVPPVEIPPVIDSGDWILPTVGTGGQISCPPGYILQWQMSNDVPPKMVQVCRRGLPPVVPPPFVPPPFVPPWDLPPVPPPPVVPPPFVPPPFVPPPPPVISQCDAEQLPAEQVRCLTIPPAPVVWHWYITVDCTDCNKPKACVWRGTKPPETYDGTLIGTVYDAPPSDEEIRRVAIQCAIKFGGPGDHLPPSPPPPFGPPSSPPPPPPDTQQCVDDAAASYFAGETVDGQTVCSPLVFVDIPPTPTIYDGCVKYIQDIRDAYKPVVHTRDTITGAPTTVAGSITRTVLGFFNPAIAPISGIAADVIWDKAVGNYRALTNEISDAAIEAQANIIRKTGDVFPDDFNAVLGTTTKMSIAAWVQRVTGAPMDYLTQQLTYQLHSLVPVYVPSQAEIDDLRITGKMSREAWTCYTKMQGNKPELFEPILSIKANRPNANEIVSLFRRNPGFGTDQLTKRMLDVGVQDEKTVHEYVMLSEQIPQAPDIIRFMVRDAFDDIDTPTHVSAVTKYGMDDEFKDKYTANAERMGFAAGLSTETARYEWRTHWHTPSDTTLYTMTHQLNPNRPEVRNWDDLAKQQGNDVALATFGPRPQVFTTADLEYALKINDNLPTFVKSMVAIQYRPITNTDAARMYEIGYMTEEAFEWAIVKNGYTESDAKNMVGFYKAQRTKRISNDTGVWTGRKILQAYKSGTIDRQLADELLAEKIVDKPLREQQLDRAMLEVDVETRQVRVKALKTRFMYGEYDEAELRSALHLIGIAAGPADRLTDQWSALRAGRGKEPKVAMLCEWYTHGFIQFDEYLTRLTRLGYTYADAERIASVCSVDEQAKRAKAAAAAADKLRRETEHQLRTQKQNLAAEIKKLQAEIKVLQQEHRSILIAAGLA